MTGPALVRTRAELRRALGDGTEGARALVMTMGALHAGHLELVRAAREAAGPNGQVVVSIFVNPLQFGPDEDFARYPRDLDADLALLADSGAVDLVFAPATAELYPSGPLVTVSAGSIGRVLEGRVRPGHFDGVLTVVLKVLNLVRPDTAVFGEKDAQQLMAVRRMVADLDLDVEIRGVPIVRDVDGLALSSRNAYLSADDRRRALALAGALRAGAEAGERGASAVGTAAQAVLDAAGIVPDYLALVDPATVEEVSPDFSGTALLLVAARVGPTRLIDNTAVRLGAPARPGGA